MRAMESPGTPELPKLQPGPAVMKPSMRIDLDPERDVGAFGPEPPDPVQQQRLPEAHGFYYYYNSIFNQYK